MRPARQQSAILHPVRRSIDASGSFSQRPRTGSLCRLRGDRRMNPIDEIKREATGMAILRDWWGDGLHHVRQEIADHRSKTCVAGDDGNPCPHNKAPRWWEHHKSAIADAIIHQIGVKERLKLSTPLENSLAMCSICGCCLQLKVWTPIEHIARHMPVEQLARYPEFCWQRKEITHV